MQRIATTTRAVDLFGAGKHGFKDGNLGLGVLPTDFEALFCNQMQEEVMAIIEGAGVAPSNAVSNQIVQAIRRLAGANITSIVATAAPNPNVINLTVDNAGLILVDATLQNVVINLPAANVVAGLPIEYAFERLDATANTVTVNRAGADVIDGAASFALTGQYASRVIRSNAAAVWATLASSTAASLAKQIQAINAGVAASALTLTLNPTQLDFRAPALTSGTVNTRNLAAAANLVVPSGATLGTVNAVANRLVLVALDNAGVIELAVVNLAGGNNLDETTLISTTAISAGANAASVVYSATARANLPFRIVGFVGSTQAVAGTWATAPSTIQGTGGQALAAMSSLGYGQTWQDVTGSRALGTTYYNTTGKPIAVAAGLVVGAIGGFLGVVVNGVLAVSGYAISNAGGGLFCVVPANASYVYSAGGASGAAISSAQELR